jgi:hypothetical protein
LSNALSYYHGVRQVVEQPHTAQSLTDHRFATT